MQLQSSAKNDRFIDSVLQHLSACPDTMIRKFLLYKIANCCIYSSLRGLTRHGLDFIKHTCKWTSFTNYTILWDNMKRTFRSHSGNALFGWFFTVNCMKRLRFVSCFNPLTPNVRYFCHFGSSETEPPGLSHVRRAANVCSVWNIGGFSVEWSTGISASLLERWQFAVKTFDFSSSLNANSKNLWH